MKDCEKFPELANYSRVNEAPVRFSERTPHTAFASAEGLTSNPDDLHFNHSSLREFGLRYYAAFKTVEDKTPIFDEKSNMDGAIRAKMELL